MVNVLGRVPGTEAYVMPTIGMAGAKSALALHSSHTLTIGTEMAARAGGSLPADQINEPRLGIACEVSSSCNLKYLTVYNHRCQDVDTQSSPITLIK